MNIGASSDIFKAVAAKKIDAGGAQHEFSRTAEQLGIRVLYEYVKEIPHFTNQGAFSPIKAIVEKRDLLVRTPAGYGRAYRYVDGPSSKQAWIKAYKDGVGPDGETLATGGEPLETKAYNVAIVLSPERINYMQQLNVALGVQKGRSAARAGGRHVDRAASRPSSPEKVRSSPRL